MIAPDLLAILRCPETRQELAVASAADVATANQRIAAGVNNRGGKAVAEPLQEGLVRADRKVLYPIRKGIPVLLIEEGIPLA